MRDFRQPSGWPVLVVLVSAAILLAACGQSADKADRDRPGALATTAPSVTSGQESIGREESGLPGESEGDDDYPEDDD